MKMSFLYRKHLHPLSIHWNTSTLILILTHHLTGFFTINHSMFSESQEDLMERGHFFTERECYLVTPLFQFAMYKPLGQAKGEYFVLLVWFPSQPPQIVQHPAPPTIHSVICADLPVQEIESTPGPWYSMMAPVPPFTVRMPATFRITSLGEVQPESLPVSFTPIT